MNDNRSKVVIVSFDLYWKRRIRSNAVVPNCAVNHFGFRGKNKDEKGRNKIQRFPEISFPINLSSLDLSQPKKTQNPTPILHSFTKKQFLKAYFWGQNLKWTMIYIGLYWAKLKKMVFLGTKMVPCTWSRQFKYL